jgi:hypothetical protein
MLIFHPSNIRFVAQSNVTEEDPDNVYEIKDFKRLKIGKVKPDIMLLQVRYILSLFK